MNIKFIDLKDKNITIETKGFSGGERHIQLGQLPTVQPKVLNVRCNILSSDDLMDLLLFQNALDNYYSQAVKLNLEIPYLPYARQDRVCAKGQAFSLQLFTKLLNLLHINKLTVWDCHSHVSVDLTNAINREATDIIKYSPDLISLLQEKNSVVICPDKGAVFRCQKIVDNLRLNTMIKCEKVRNPITGKITHTDVLVDDLSGKTAIITDDICDGGYTFIKIAEQLKTKNVKRVVLYITHGIFSKGMAVFDGLVDEIYTTQSFPQKKHPILNIIKVGEIS